MSLELKLAEELKRGNFESTENLRVLFTGHSAGGGVAQMLYVWSRTPNSVLFETLQGMCW